MTAGAGATARRAVSPLVPERSEATIVPEVPMAVRVLVVDDQLPFRLAMTAVVEATDGFEVVGEAASGEDSVDACAALAPDLVLMDVNLPGIDGLEATRRIRAASPAPVVLLLSTYDAAEGEAFAAESGAVGYVTKSELAPDRITAAWASAG